jgi:hypothetical protein
MDNRRIYVETKYNNNNNYYYYHHHNHNYNNNKHNNNYNNYNNNNNKLLGLNTALLLKVKNSYAFRLAKIAITRL